MTLAHRQGGPIIDHSSVSNCSSSYERSIALTNASRSFSRGNPGASRDDSWNAIACSQHASPAKPDTSPLDPTGLPTARQDRRYFAIQMHSIARNFGHFLPPITGRAARAIYATDATRRLRVHQVRPRDARRRHAAYRAPPGWRTNCPTSLTQIAGCP